MICSFIEVQLILENIVIVRFDLEPKTTSKLVCRNTQQQAYAHIAA